MKLSSYKKWMMLLSCLFMAMGYAKAQLPDEIYDIYEFDRTLNVSAVFDPNADLTGGIVGTMLDDADSTFVDVVVIDNRDNTIIYEMYLNHNSTTYVSDSILYYAPDLGDGASFFPYTWYSKDIKSSLNGLDKYYYETEGAGVTPFFQDSLDVRVVVIVYNATFMSIKIPGISGTISETETQTLSAGNEWFPVGHRCYNPAFADQCPCKEWKKAKDLHSSTEDFILVAHRGVWGGLLGNGAPENSAASIEAVTDDLFIIESDVMFSADRKLMITHDYALTRLSDFSGTNKSFWFNTDYGYPDIDYFWWLAGATKPFHLKRRNGTVTTDQFYLQFIDVLNLLKKKQLVTTVDIKTIMRRNNPDGTCDACAYDPTTPEGRAKIQRNWLDIFSYCFQIAERRNMLDYLTFKLPFTYDFLKTNGGFTDKQLAKVLFIPIKDPNPSNMNPILDYIDDWAEKDPKGIVAIESHFKTDSAAGPFKDTRSGHYNDYSNILEYIYKKGYRTAIFPVEPIGPKGIVDRYADWRMKNVVGDRRGDHLWFRNIPYISTAVVTTDRPDVWIDLRQPQNINFYSANITSSLTRNTSQDSAATRIKAYYKSGSIYISGLNHNDIGSAIYIYDMQGRVLLNKIINQEPDIVISGEFQVGIYMIKISGDRNETVKLTINNK
ncbi:MAG: T9SS type A sorting domain-containing protein [Tannerella sp.]|nr:T9SS type A sorting domain-containing protein [Tannerella sp.]